MSMFLATICEEGLVPTTKNPREAALLQLVGVFSEIYKLLLLYCALVRKTKVETEVPDELLTRLETIQERLRNKISFSKTLLNDLADRFRYDAVGFICRTILRWFEVDKMEMHQLFKLLSIVGECLRYAVAIAPAVNNSVPRQNQLKNVFRRQIALLEPISKE